MNNFRKNPKELAKKLELIRTYLDPESNILSEPNKIQIQMVEGDAVFKEAIQFLKSLPPLPPLIWDENLAQSAQEHVNDIGPKGLLLYQSSDGTEPEDRIAKYGNYSEPLGENIDFGPNDAMGVIVSLTLDDGEEQRPHRENLFKDDFKKVGIACGPHETEFQMCVMDFAYDFQPLNNQRNNNIRQQEMNRDNVMKNQYNQNMENNENKKYMNNQSPVVKLSLDKEELKNNNLNMQRQNNEENAENINQQYGQDKPNDEIGQVINDTINSINNTKIVKKRVEIITTITYTYEDGSTKVITQNQTHDFNN